MYATSVNSAPSARDVERSAQTNDTRQPGRVADSERELLDRHPDLQIQIDDPSPARHNHDLRATDAAVLYLSDTLVDRLIAGPGNLDPDQQVSARQYEKVRRQLQRFLKQAYDASPTFRRLYNHAACTSLNERRWLLAPDSAFATTVGDDQRAAAGNRAVIALNLDPFDPNSGDSLDPYESADGPCTFSAARSYIHEVIHALTDLRDDEDCGHARGPVVEYENLILKEMGEDSPARIAYQACSSESAVSQDQGFDLDDIVSMMTAQPEPALTHTPSGASSLPRALDLDEIREMMAFTSEAESGEPSPLEPSTNAVAVQAQSEEPPHPESEPSFDIAGDGPPPDASHARTVSHSNLTETTARPKDYDDPRVRTVAEMVDFARSFIPGDMADPTLSTARGSASAQPPLRIDEPVPGRSSREALSGWLTRPDVRDTFQASLLQDVDDPSTGTLERANALWLNMLRVQVEVSSIDASHVLSMLTESTRTSSGASYANALSSRAAYRPEHAMAMVDLLGAIAAKIGPQRVREALLHAKDSFGDHPVIEARWTHAHFYQWLANDDCNYRSRNEALLARLNRFDLLPEKRELDAVTPVYKRVLGRRSTKLHDKIVRLAAAGKSASVPAEQQRPLRSLHSLAAEVVVALPADTLRRVDSDTRALREAAAVRRARDRLHAEMRQKVSKQVVDAWRKKMSDTRRSMELTSLASHWLDDTGAHSAVWFEESQKLSLAPPDRMLQEIVDEIMRLPDVVAALNLEENERLRSDAYASREPERAAARAASSASHRAVALASDRAAHEASDRASKKAAAQAAAGAAETAAARASQGAAQRAIDQVSTQATFTAVERASKNVSERVSANAVERATGAAVDRAATQATHRAAAQAFDNTSTAHVQVSQERILAQLASEAADRALERRLRIHKNS